MGRLDPTRLCFWPVIVDGDRNQLDDLITLPIYV